MSNVKNIFIVLSGKGGVGKSTVSVMLSYALAELNYKVGLLDVDVCGPSIGLMLGIKKMNVFKSENGWRPIEISNTNRNLVALTIDLLLPNDDSPIIWKGPKKNAFIKEFLFGVDWGELDYLVIDTPPGTSDEHIALAECLAHHKNVRAILVTTPQAIAVNDVLREATFCKSVNIQTIGIIENMSGFSCKNCKETSYIFGKGGADALSKITNIPVIAKLPMNQSIQMSMEKGLNPMQSKEKDVEEFLNCVQSFSKF